MLNQTFNPKSLYNIATIDDVKKYNLGKNKLEVMSSITSISYDVSQSDFKFTNIKKTKINNKGVYIINDRNEYFAIKKLNYTLHTIYKIKHQGRNEILKQFINIINDGSDYKIIRIDIKDFFNEINRRDLFYKIKKDSFLGSLMIRKLNELDSFLIEDKCDGLPRGLSISSTLSELYLRNFDSSIKSNDNVYFYGRYVDDIIVVCLDNVYAVDDLIKKSLNNIGLSVNDKYEIIDDIKSDFCFDYLGVKFKSSNGKIEQLLSSKKIRKIKSRIIKSILDYRVNNDDVLLLDRLLFLSSNYHLYTRTESNNLKAGIYYNNQFINSYYQLSELNTFLRKSITARRGTLYKVVKKIPYNIVKECMKISFFDGFINKRIVSFSSERISKIVKCWKYE